VVNTIKTQYKHKWIEGEVVATYEKRGVQKWIAKYQDGYIRHYTRNQIEKVLVHACKEKIGRQLDYILVSTRWKSCVVHCKPKWGPSIHRDLHGERNDHALVECQWKWRIRSTRSTPCKDYECLYAQHYDSEGNPCENPVMCKFEEAINAKLAELAYDADNDDTTAMYDKICSAIHHAVESVLPTRAKTSGVRREVSQATQRLFEERTKMRGKCTYDQFKELQQRIVSSSLKDFETWVDGWADEISEANGRGDTKKIFKGVKVLAGKPEKPSPNLTTDKDGHMLKCAEDVANAWNTFLSAKFAATEDEHNRPELDDLSHCSPTGTSSLTP
jgi:hypothetical protein